MGEMALEFLVSRRSLRETSWREAAPAPLAPGQARLAVGRFALTANNVTYAAFGEAMNYWSFFPAPDGYGLIPVWGFATVAESRAQGLEAGERLYGYFPMASHLTVDVTRLTPGGFVDGAAHRAGLPAIYNPYLRISADPAFSPAREAGQALLRPLFMTSFLIDDFLAEQGFFGAGEVLVSSASSKTSLGLAFTLKRAARDGVAVVGLTSPANRAFVEATGYYDRVAVYDEIAGLPVRPAVFVDMAGSAPVRAAVHQRFGDALAYSCSVGGSHWEDLGSGKGLPGPRPMLFFAPAQAKKRHADWGPGGLEKRYAPVWEAFLADSAGWLRIDERSGRDGVEAAYRELLDGRVRPETGVMACIAPGAAGQSV